jgi:transcriptional regulator
MSMASLKVRVLMRQGDTMEEAIDQVYNELVQANIQMDEKLAQCMQYLNKEQMEEIFPFEGE